MLILLFLYAKIVSEIIKNLIKDGVPPKLIGSKLRQGW